MPECVESISAGINPSCAGLKKAGGVQRELYVGAIQDIDSITYDETDGFISAIAMKTGKQMVKIVGKLMKHSATEAIQEEGEGNVKLFQHTVNAVVYHFTQAERNAIEAIVQLDQAFVIVPTRAKQFLVYGVAKADEPFDQFGLSANGGEDTTGVQLNDQSAQEIALVGMMLNKSIIFGEGATYDANATAVEALTTPAV